MNCSSPNMGGIGGGRRHWNRAQSWKHYMWEIKFDMSKKNFRSLSMKFTALEDVEISKKNQSFNLIDRLTRKTTLDRPENLYPSLYKSWSFACQISASYLDKRLSSTRLNILVRTWNQVFSNWYLWRVVDRSCAVILSWNSVCG